jgi:hypothetical protein
MATTESRSNTFNYAQDVSLDKLDIILADGKRYVIKALLIELNYFEDIFGFVTSGYMTLRDSVGLVESLSLNGEESIEIKFGKTVNDSRPTQTFRLYSIPRRIPAANMNGEVLHIYFCSEELLTSELSKVTKAYKGFAINGIVQRILKDELKSNKKFYSDYTAGTYDFNVPTLKPLEAISWLSTYALPFANNRKGADMLFYENYEGFHFRSLGKLYEQTPYKTYKYQQKNAGSIEQDVISVLDYEFVKNFDVLSEVSAGTFANRLISIDPITRGVKVTDFDYLKYEGSTLNRNKPESPVPVVSPKSVIKFSVSNSEQVRQPFIPTGSTSPDIYAETTIPNRTAQIALANFTVLKIKIPGDPNISVGKVIIFNMLKTTRETSTTESNLDNFYSGKYIVTAVRHIIQSQGVFQTVLEISKESNPRAS